MIDFAKYKHELIAWVKNSADLDPHASDEATRYGYIYCFQKKVLNFVRNRNIHRFFFSQFIWTPSNLRSDQLTPSR